MHERAAPGCAGKGEGRLCGEEEGHRLVGHGRVCRVAGHGHAVQPECAGAVEEEERPGQGNGGCACEKGERAEEQCPAAEADEQGEAVAVEG